MTKCGACGQFLATSRTGAERAKCSKCLACYCFACLLIPTNTKISKSWSCPACKNQQPKGDNTLTPVKDLSSAYKSPPPPQPQVNQTSSDTVLNTTEELKDSVAIALEIRLFREELQALRSSFTDEIQKLRVELREEIKEMFSEFGEFRASLQSCTERMDRFDDKIALIEGKVAAAPNESAVLPIIEGLRHQLNERDQELLLNDVDIAGVPEGSDDTTHIVKLIALKLGVVVDDRDIVHVARVGTKRFNDRPANDDPSTLRPRNIAVRFARRNTRDQLLQAARVRRVITSDEIELAGAPRRIYLNERLSRTNRALFARTREAARKFNYRYVWTREGRIFVRKEDGRPAERIRADADVDKIFHS